MPGWGRVGASSKNVTGAPSLETENSQKARTERWAGLHTLVWMPTLIRILPRLDSGHNIDRLLRVPRGLEPIPGKEESCTAWPCQTHGGASLTSVSPWQEAQTCYIKDLACSWSPSKNTQPRAQASKSRQGTSEANPPLS